MGKKADDAGKQLETIREKLDVLQKAVGESKPVEVTALVERLELLEEKVGVRFEGIYARCSKQYSEIYPQYLVEVAFDVVGTGAALERSLKLRLNAYNAAGQLLSTEWSLVNNETFMGITSENIEILCDQAPSRLRLFPELF